jgi:RNA polymerase-binding transcription factor DksA
MEHANMNTKLTAGQRMQLQELLELRRQELERRLASSLGAQGRAEQAREHLLEGADDEAPRDADREVDLAQAELERAELGAVAGALARLHEPGFGQCMDCGKAIPFERLKVEPWAARCVPCQEARERRAP